MTPVTPVTLSATRMAVGLRPASGMVVLSVHRAAIDLIGPDGGLLAIVDARAGGIPDGILVDRSGGPDDLRALGIRPGMPARWSDGSCRLGPDRLVVDLAAARPWSARVPAMAFTTWPIHRRRTLELADRAAGPIAARVGHGRLAAFGDALAHDDAAATTRAARALVGRGPGLTPSGDDVLTGALAVVHAVAHPGRAWIAAALDDVDARTTRVGAAMLRCAARGEVAERLHILLAALACDGAERDGATIDAAVRSMLDWGATSGADLLWGTITALDAIARLERRVAA